MKLPLLLASTLFLLSACAVQKATISVNRNDVERIIKTLSSDEMQGREVFTPGIEKAARFIESEFAAIGLQPLPGESNFRQNFPMTHISPGVPAVSIEGSAVEPSKVIVISSKPALSWNQNSGVEQQFVKAGESFISRYRSIIAAGKPTLVFVDEQFVDVFKRLRDHYMQDRVGEDEGKPSAEVVFVLGPQEKPQSFSISFANEIKTSPLFNVAGIIPGKSKPKEYVIFSGHYDHLGIIEPVDGDSIANGADDDASGVTAVISLARYYKKQNNNERTLIFVAFTAEEIGLIGSQHFSEKINPDEVVAMFNIEMIGKESKFGKNTAFITGFERSNFAQILQKNLAETPFKFHPDPYPAQQLFYRSDNATLASQGVPAHTISTDQIDNDKYYHTVDDEISTLDIDNITATIQAIALSSRSIVSGMDTPTRVPLPEKEGER